MLAKLPQSNIFSVARFVMPSASQHIPGIPISYAVVITATTKCRDMAHTIFRLESVR